MSAAEHGAFSVGRATADPLLANAGRKAGIEVWRVENRRGDGEGGAAVFGIAPWPEKRVGQFHRGDAYLVLKTTQLGSGGMEHDIFFWLGGEATQDERTVAAVKAVELDSLLGGLAVQHRETEGNESTLFQSMFTSISYLDGGIDSGFTHAKVGSALASVDALTIPAAQVCQPLESDTLAIMLVPLRARARLVSPRSTSRVSSR